MSKYLSIPQDFYSDLENSPFEQCKLCHTTFSDETLYVIEKAYQKIADGPDVTLFEVAICFKCSEKQALKMSTSSRKKMEKIMGNQDFLAQQKEKWKGEWSPNWKDTCAITNHEISPNQEYHIVGYFKGSQIIPYQVPFVIGNEILEQIQENLSPETKEEMDRLGHEILGPDPTLKAILEEKQFILI